MTILEKSVRKQLRFYRADLRSGKYLLPGSRCTTPVGRPQYIKAAVADVADGVCTNISIYAVDDAQEERHYYMLEGTVSIVEAVCDYLEAPDASYDSLVGDICDAIRKASVKEVTPKNYVGEMIPLTQYAEMHGRSPVAARQRAQRGGFVSAVKIGRDWLIREDEPYGDLRLASERMRRPKR